MTTVALSIVARLICQRVVSIARWLGPCQTSAPSPVPRAAGPQFSQSWNKPWSAITEVVSARTGREARRSWAAYRQANAPHLIVKVETYR